jgi:hypothetical protein
MKRHPDLEAKRLAPLGTGAMDCLLNRANAYLKCTNASGRWRS